MADVKERDRTLTCWQFGEMLSAAMVTDPVRFGMDGFCSVKMSTLLNDEGAMVVVTTDEGPPNHELPDVMLATIVMHEDPSGIELDLVLNKVRRYNDEDAYPDFDDKIGAAVQEYNSLLMLLHARTLGCPPAMADLIDEDTADPVPWLILADWCEEHGHQPLADRLRKGRALSVV